MGDSNGEEQMEAMARAVKIVLEGLGEDVSREGLLDTPKVSERLSRGSTCHRLRKAMWNEHV